MGLVETAPDGVLDLNKAADNLKVQKRRIYDITNVLEGIGLIEKKLKNNIQWKGGTSADPADDASEQVALRHEVNLLQQDEQTLKTCIKELEDSIKAMTEDESNAARLYVTDEDIAKLPCTANDTVFAVKAPQGTTLEVPDPDEGLANGERRYRIILKSNCSVPIDVWLVSGIHKEQQQEMQQPDAHAQASVAPQAAQEQADMHAPGPSQQPGMQMCTNVEMDASPAFMRVNQNEADAAWFQHNEPSVLGIADMFDHDQDLGM